MENNKKNTPNLSSVSILMNCYNGEAYLHEAIESVINQTYQNWELIFWDNQSTDNSKIIFDSFEDKRLRYFFSDEHTDLGGGRAKAFHHLSGDFIAVIDTDDLWLPTKLEKQLKLFKDPEVGLVISDTMFFNESNERAVYGESYPPEGYVFRELFTGYFVSLVSLIVRKSTVEKLNYGFDADFSFIADFDLVLRTAQISKLSICKEVLAKWRVHEESDSWRSPVSFCYERERWIEKQQQLDSSFLSTYRNEISALHSKNFLLIAINHLSNNERLNSIKFLSKTNFKDWHIFALALLCFIPFSNILIQCLLKRRMKRLLK